MENIIYALVFLLKMVPDAPDSRIIELAPAIAEMAKNKEEVALLAATAYYETGPDRYNCSLRGLAGEISCFQILTQDPEEKVKLHTTRYAAQRAIQFIRMANKVCRHLHPANRLGYYTTGRCMGEYSARARYIKSRELLNLEIEVSDKILDLKSKIYPEKTEFYEIEDEPQAVLKEFSRYKYSSDSLEKLSKYKKEDKEYLKPTNCPVCNNKDQFHQCPLCKY